MLNSAEHEILNAHNYKKYQEIQLFSGSDKPRMLFVMLINVKMPTIVGILTFVSRKNFMLSQALVYSVFSGLRVFIFQLDYTSERYKVLQGNAEGYKKEIAHFREKSQKYSTAVAKHEQTINTLKQVGLFNAFIYNNCI